jgi:thiamine-phosphate diphosphorylase
MTDIESKYPGPVAVPLQDRALGVYAVVDSAAWVQRVLQAGLRTVQLRIKHTDPKLLATEIAASVACAQRVPGAQLFINDHWQLAMDHGAYGVHLGQEDLDSADVAALYRASMRVGISTHSHGEMARALGFKPSYVACGPVFPTQSKVMPWEPQGLQKLRYWTEGLPLPLVGIGGITAQSMAAVAAQGVAGAAVISAITQAADPERACVVLAEQFLLGRRQFCEL